MGKLTLVTGGSRSGKSTYALRQALAYQPDRVFAATAIAFDQEMQDRIQKHQEERVNQFITFEEPLYLSTIWEKIPKSSTVCLIDCMTVWLGNLFYTFENQESLIDQEIDLFINSLRNKELDIFIVTNEVGWGIIPENALSRKFRDYAGMVNRRIAEVSDNVFLCCCGLAHQFK